jgi:hypothetical protein
MRELRFVTLSEDGAHLLVEATDAGEQFSLGVTDALRESLRGAPQPARAAPPRPEPRPEPVAEAPIGPREIQVRVRAGESPEALAAEFGMSLDRVMRFAAAAVDERLRIKGEARRARARRSGPDGSEGRFVQFGEAVDERFWAHGIDADSVSWDARRRDDGEWLVVANWLGGESTHSAEWQFSRASRTVTPLDDAAADLLSDRPIRPVAAPEPARPALSVAPPLVPGVVAFPPMADAETGPLPRLDDVFDQFAHDAPPLPLGIAEPATRPAAGAARAGRRDESEEERAARARIPSWDDILLGVKRRD